MTFDPVWLKVDDRSFHDPLGVLAASVDHQGFADAGVPGSFMDMSVQTQHGLNIFNNLAHCCAADRLHHHLTAPGNDLQILIQLRADIDTRIIGWNMQHHDSLMRFFKQGCEPDQLLLQLFFLRIPIALPGGHVGIRKTNQLMVLIQPVLLTIWIVHASIFKLGDDIID